MLHNSKGGVIYPPLSPLEEARQLERKAMFSSCLKLGGLLLGYELFKQLLVYVFYGIVASVHGGGFYLLPWDSIPYLKAHQEVVKTTSFSMGVNLSVVLVGSAVMLLTARFVFKIRFGDQLVPKKEHMPQAFKWFPLCLLVNVVFSLIINYIQSYFAAFGFVIPESDFSIQQPSVLALVLQFTYVIIVGPVVEELIFRGLIISVLKPYGKWLAVFFSAFSFGIMHGNIPQAVATFTSALVMGAVAVKCNSIVPTIIIHIINNIFASYFDFSDIIGWPYASEIYMAVQILTMFAGVFVLMVFGWQLLRVQESRYALTLKQRMGAVFLNAGMLAFYGYELYSMLKQIILAN